MWTIFYGINYDIKHFIEAADYVVASIYTWILWQFCWCIRHNQQYCYKYCRCCSLWKNFDKKQWECHLSKDERNGVIPSHPELFCTFVYHRCNVVLIIVGASVGFIINLWKINGNVVLSTIIDMCSHFFTSVFWVKNMRGIMLEYDAMYILWCLCCFGLGWSSYH